jgi:hypothetical protein
LLAVAAVDLVVVELVAVVELAVSDSILDYQSLKESTILLSVRVETELLPTIPVEAVVVTQQHLVKLPMVVDTPTIILPPRLLVDLVQELVTVLVLELEMLVETIHLHLQ